VQIRRLGELNLLEVRGHGQKKKRSVENEGAMVREGAVGNASIDKSEAPGSHETGKK